MKYEDDVEDILGPRSWPAPRPRFVPKKVKPTPRPAAQVIGPVPAAAKPDDTQQTAAEIRNGVTVFWLAKSFGMEASTVRKKLADCPYLARKTSGYLYSLPVAASFLVRPKLNIRQYLEQMKPNEMPTQLQPTYWEGVLKRQKFESIAKELWYSEDVMEVFSEVFKTIKFTLQLWPDTLERTGNFSDEDRAALTRMADQLSLDIHGKIAELAKAKTTPNSLERFLQQTGQFEDEEVEDIL